MGNLRESCTNEEWDNMPSELAKALKGTKKKSGFVDVVKEQGCRDREHCTPTHLYIPPNKEYHHVCPSCGQECILVSPQFTL
jgi:predicted RNA-binding Zn-ribbon protein involved in translation (DUF1610 family)